MRNILFVLFFMSCNFSLFAMSKLELDPAFIEFKSKLNPDWKIKIEKDILRIERKEPVLVMPVNRINAPIAPVETEKEKLDKMKKYGMKMIPNMIYRFQKRWTVNDTIKAELKRDKIQEKIYTLPKKYKIEHLRDKNLSSKGGEFYIPTTKTEKKRVKAYFDEKTKLEGKIPPLPDYHLNKFSLFFISKKGISNEYTDAYPESVMGEFIQIEKLLFKYRVMQ